MNPVEKLMLLCFRGGLTAAYSAMKLFIRPRDRVVFLSRQRDEPSDDFHLLADEIMRQSPETDVVFSCRLGLKSSLGVSYIPLLLSQMRLLASARACVTESYCPPVSLLRHRKNMRVVQVWHSAVAIKKFGWQTVGMPEGSDADTAKLMKMHAGYDWVCAGSEYQRRFFAEAMNTPVERVLPLGTAGADRLVRVDREAARRRLLERYPQAKGKTICVWSPTMRRGEGVDCGPLVSAIDHSRCLLIIRPHPLDRLTATDDSRVVVEREVRTTELMAGADAVISDYSGAAAEASLIGAKVFFYLPDLKRYDAQCGVNIDPTEVFPTVSFTGAEELAEALNDLPNADPAAQARVRELLAGGCDGHSTGRIARLVLTGRPDE